MEIARTCSAPDSSVTQMSFTYDAKKPSPHVEEGRLIIHLVQNGKNSAFLKPLIQASEKRKTIPGKKSVFSYKLDE